MKLWQIAGLGALAWYLWRNNVSIPGTTKHVRDLFGGNELPKSQSTAATQTQATPTGQIATPTTPLYSACKRVANLTGPTLSPSPVTMYPRPIAGGNNFSSQPASGNTSSGGYNYILATLAG